MKLSLDGYIAATGDDLGWSVPRKAALSPLEPRLSRAREAIAPAERIRARSPSAPNHPSVREHPDVGGRAPIASWIEVDAPQRRTPR